MPTLSWVLVVVFTLALFETGSAVRCYQCLLGGKDCADNPNIANLEPTIVEDCTYCWKSKTLYPHGVNIVTRGCTKSLGGSANGDDGCLSCNHGTDCGTRKTECSCYSDLCNASERIVPSLLALVIMMCLSRFIQ